MGEKNHAAWDRDVHPVVGDGDAGVPERGEVKRSDVASRVGGGDFRLALGRRFGESGAGHFPDGMRID